MKASNIWDFVSQNVSSFVTIISAIIILIYQRVVGFSIESLLAGVLLVLSLLAISELVDRTRKLEKIDKQIKSLTDQLVTRNSSATIKTFENADDGVAYIAHKARTAQRQIDHVSLSAPIPRNYQATPVFEKAIEEVALANKVKIRYIANFSDIARLDRVRKLLNNPKVKNYLVCSVNPNNLPIHMLNFIIFDEEEIIFGVPGAAEQNAIIAVKNDSIIRSFERYFVQLFVEATRINVESPIINETVV